MRLSPDLEAKVLELAGVVPATPAQPSKYRNKKIEYDGFTFDSKKELNRYLDLRAEQADGRIAELRRQLAFPLVVNGEVVASYVCDFVYKRDGKLVIEDVKSAVTRKLPAYRIKVKLMWACYRIKVEEV